MMIYSMTATFGKLEHETLTLKPGLNIIEAPNEWGKSTWCAFLLAMLYGLDTRAKASRTALPDRERYAPWSGSPMSGRMELRWNGRDITIERSTRGRIPMGEFRAYETASGMNVPELNAGNCGLVLLGVERSVFQRAGFIRQSDLPVTQDDDLRRRLNALVTTGDESADASRLEKGLRELKNRCRYNRSGLLPQALQRKQQLEDDLEELARLESRLTQGEADLEKNRESRADLENHLDALAYEQAKLDEERVARVRDNREAARSRLKQLEESCAGLPSPEEIEEKLALLRGHREQWEQFRQQSLPPLPRMPEVPACFLGMSPDQALHQAREDGKNSRHWAWALLALGVVCLGAAAGLAFYGRMLPAGLLGAMGLLTLGIAAAQWMLWRRRRRVLCRRYGSSDPRRWEALARDYAAARADYDRRERTYSESREALAARRRALLQQHQSLCGEKSLEQCIRELEDQLRIYQQTENARGETRRACGEYENLKAMARTAPPPRRADCRRESVEETEAELSRLAEQERLLRGQLGQYRGAAETLPPRENVERELEQLKRRIRELERWEAALTLAQQTLSQATEELQRRFAPRISQGAQELMARLTLGRYDRLRLESDLSLQAGAREEDTLRSARWRSAGTADQLYLALRLSVARELTPGAPLILDDALVRFDEQRLRAAMEVLKEFSQSRQVILFTCQTRENEIMCSSGYPCKL